MSNRRAASDGDRKPIASFAPEDFERLNRMAHAQNLHSVIKCTKWLNYHGVELLRQHPEEFLGSTGMTVDEYLRALRVHVESCRSFLDKA